MSPGTVLERFLLDDECVRCAWSQFLFWRLSVFWPSFAGGGGQKSYVVAGKPFWTGEHVEGLSWLRCLIVIVVIVMTHPSKGTCFKFYILLQGLDGVQVPVRRVLARTDYQAPTCAEWVPISLLSNSLLQMTPHQRLEGYLSSLHAQGYVVSCLGVLVSLDPYKRHRPSSTCKARPPRSKDTGWSRRLTQVLVLR